MSEIKTYNNYPVSNSPPFSGRENSQLILEAHTSSDMKVKRPRITANSITGDLPTQKSFSDAEATKKMQTINTDIYEKAKKEKEHHEFNFKRYLTIFGIIALLTAAITYFRKGK